MAKIDLATFRNLPSDGKPAPVGNNRMAQRLDDETRTIVCRLHRHPIVEFEFAGETPARIKLDRCGYMSATTRQAMKDFLEAQTGLIWGISFAGDGWGISCGGLNVSASFEKAPRAVYIDVATGNVEAL